MRNTNHRRFFYDNRVLDPPKHKKDPCKHKQQKQKHEHVFSKKLAMSHYTTYIDRHCQCPFRNLYRDSVHTPPADEAVWKYFILCYKSRQCRRRCKPDSPTARGEPSWTIQHARLDSQSFLEQPHAGSLYTLTRQRWLYRASERRSPLGKDRSRCDPRRCRCRWQCWVRCVSWFLKINEVGDEGSLIIDYRNNKGKRCLKRLSYA